MSIFDTIKKWFVDDSIPETISAQFLEIVVKKFVVVKPILRDNWYKLFSKEKVEFKLNDIMLSKRYQSETWDCDEISRFIWIRLKEMLPGIALANIDCKTPNGIDHSCILFVDENYQVWIIDNDKKVKKLDGYDIYRIEF